MMLETERVTCDLHSVLSTAQSLQMLFLQVIQKARKDSLGCAGHTATEDLSNEFEEPAEGRTRTLELNGLGALLELDAIARPCDSLQAII